MYCKICGDEDGLTGPFRFWSPDDGWIAGRLCLSCKGTELKRKPAESDFAYEDRNLYLSSEDDAISEIYG